MPGPTRSTELLEPLREVFEQRGYDGATIAQLAQATGLSKASLYHHFPGGKADMANRLLREAVAEAQQTAFDKLHATDEPAVNLRAFLDGFVRYTDRGGRPCLVHTFAQTPASGPADAARTAFGGWLQSLVSAYDALLERQRPKRAVRLAEQTLSELYGALTTGLVLDEPKLVRRTAKRWAKTVRVLQTQDD